MQLRAARHVDPVHGDWCDDVRALADAMGVLRMATGDVDETRLQQCVESACYLITAALERPAESPVSGDPPPLRTAHYLVAIELYRRKDAPFGVLNAWSPDEAAVRISTDPLRGVYSMILPWVAQFGVAG